MQYFDFKGTMHTEQLLNMKLKEYGLSFLAKELARVNNILEIIDGLAGKDMLANLALMLRVKEIDAEAARDKAVKAFTVLSTLYSDFNAKYSQLKDDKNGSKMSDLELTTRAFSYAMENNKIIYKEENSLLNGLINGWADCDTSAFIYIQFARSKGLDVVGVQVPEHYLVGYREKGKIVSYIETTLLLYNVDIVSLIEVYKDLIDDFKHKRSLAQRLPDSSDKEKLIAESDSAITALENYLACMQKKLSGIRDAHIWETKPENADPNIWTDQETFYTLFWDGLKSTPTNPRMFWLLSGDDFFKYVDRTKYVPAKLFLQYNWEQKRDLDSFKLYYSFLIFTGSRAWFFGVDNEKELFRLVREGEKIFGEDEVYKIVDKKFLLLKKILNPYDYWRSIKD